MYIVSTSKFREFADAVARLEPSIYTGERDPDDIKILLVEKLDIVPWSIFGCCEEPEDEAPKLPS